MKDVHTEHCCILHGCKYGDEDCTVTNKLGKQSYLCEVCDDEFDGFSTMLHLDNYLNIVKPEYSYELCGIIRLFLKMKNTEKVILKELLNKGLLA